jgi:hypothetical protein
VEFARLSETSIAEGEYEVMPDALKGFLIVVLVTLMSIGDAVLINYLTSEPLEYGWAALVGAIFGLLYGLEAGILLIYNLASPKGWIQMIVDMTWSLPNTIWGFVLGNVIFPIFGWPSRADSQDAGWIVYKPRSSSGFGTTTLQTHGTVNLGGAGQHELMHVLQARICGPLFLPLYAVNYVVNFFLQLLFTISIGLILWKLNIRQTPYFRPSTNSVLQGFFGWIYYATVFELWAYATGNP